MTDTPATSTSVAPEPLITFAIPYYKNAAYLLEAVASVRAQSMQDWEVIVVDDAGPEPVAELIAALGDPRITSVRNATNLGLAGNWNQCIGRARSPLVTLLHADDRLLPDYAKQVVDAAHDHLDVAAFFTDALIIGADGSTARSLTDWVKRFASRPRHGHLVGGDEGLAGILANNYVMCPTLCYRPAIVGHAPFDDRWGMVLDIDNVARLLLAGERLYGIRQPLYEYRRHSSNVTSSLTADAGRFTEELAIYRELAMRTAEAGFTRSARTARRRVMVRLHLVLRIVTDAIAWRFDAARTKALMLWNDLRRGDRA